jgi:hypothetical protein
MELKPARTRVDESTKELKADPVIVIDAPPVAATFAVPLIEVRSGTSYDARCDTLLI